MCCRCSLASRLLRAVVDPTGPLFASLVRRWGAMRALGIDDWIRLVGREVTLCW